MSKYKFVLKGKDEIFSTKANGDLTYMISAMMQFVVERTIESKITKKEFLESCKEWYEMSMKILNESENE